MLLAVYTRDKILPNFAFIQWRHKQTVAINELLLFLKFIFEHYITLQQTLPSFSSSEINALQGLDL